MDRHRSDGAGREFNAPHPGGQQFLSYADLEERYGKSRVTLWRWVRAGLLPAPYEIGPNSVGFSFQEIRERDAGLKRKTYGQAAQ
jgi:predicted DNA-binding transcriptional regulator AlpA